MDRAPCWLVDVTGDAAISACGNYRYTLTRIWDVALPLLIFVMLNPSTADAKTNDRTVVKCVAFARLLGYGGILVVNLYPWRATDPKELRKLPAAQLTPTLNDAILESVFHTWPMIICAWGANARGHYQASRVLQMIHDAKRVAHALRLLKDGTPEHPLYLPLSCRPVAL